MKKAQFYKKLKNNTVQCRLCNHFCTIAENEFGKCNVRKNINGDLYSLIYGYPVAVNVDPIEKKPLFHFQPGSLTYSLGTYGCNFKCKNCQNWDISQAKNAEEQIKDLQFIEPKKIAEEALGLSCQSISYTYTEPTIFAEYALDIMKLANDNGLKNIWVSNGFMSEECIGEILPYVDALNIDLKSIENDFYKENCDARVDPVLENLKIFKSENKHIELTTLIIPTLSEDPDMLKKLAEFIADELGAETPWHISKFSPEASWKLKDFPDTEGSSLYRAYEIGKDAGLKYVYIGNMPGDQKENTYCPKCNELSIRRLAYHIERLDNDGYCPKCEAELDIIE